MANSFESSIKDLKTLMEKVKNTSNTLSSQLSAITGTLSEQLKDIIAAFQSQNTYTSSTFDLLNGLSTGPFTLDKLTTALNLIQLYFQVTQPLDQISSELVDNLESLPTRPSNIDVVKKSINKLIEERKNLQKSENKVLREFESEVDEQKLQDLVQRSSGILDELIHFTPVTLDQLWQVTSEFTGHLQKAQELFKLLRQQGEALRDSESDEVEQLIRNWRDTIKEIEVIEQSNVIRKELNQNQESSRQAIAQSIQIHDLLEENYSFLSDLIRSGDLVSSGIL